MGGKEKQIDKDINQTELEVEQFHVTKQKALNEIEVSIPLNISQIYPFVESGAMSTPESLEKTEEQETQIKSLIGCDSRKMVDDMPLGSFVVIPREDLDNLRDRIGGLKSEIEEARVELKSLHKQKTSIERTLRQQRAAIEEKKEKLKNLQILKFGREVDIDDLEALADRSAEKEIENSIAEIEENFRVQQAKLLKEKDKLTDKFIRVTKENTALMNELSGLTKKRLDITRELNSVKMESTGDSKLAAMAEEAENERLRTVLRAHEREIEMIRNEINMLKRKDGNVTASYIPAIPQSRDPNEFKLPPISRNELSKSFPGKPQNTLSHKPI